MSQAAPYSYISFLEMRQAIARRLYDPTMVFWSDAELVFYATEALRTWNAFTSYWRGDFNFASQQNVTWYDLTDTTNLPNTLRPITVTDEAIYQEILYHMLEPVTGPVSLQFTTDDVYQAMARRRDELLSISGCTQTITTVGAVAGRITLDDRVIDVRRMAYLPTSSVLTGAGYGVGRYGFGLYGRSASPGHGMPLPSVVWADDTWGEQSFNPLYTILPAGTPGTPSTYLLSTQPPLSFDVDTPPAFAGSYQLLTVNAGADIVPGLPQTMSIPDDWTHVIKWGALADLFGRESNAQDTLRAQYCEGRYRMGAAALATAPALLAMRNGNVPLQIDAVREADQYRATWQAEYAGNPSLALHAGLNLVALVPVPDTGHLTIPYSLTATVVENAPIPALDDDDVQVGRDDLDAVIDYAVHLAMLKSGGAEFVTSISLFQRFMKQATLYNSKLNELGEFTKALYGLSAREQAMNPRVDDEQVLESK
jgi:hypothetical protein